MLKSEAPAEEFNTETVVGKQMEGCAKVSSGTGSPRTVKGTLDVVWEQP
jgi:hypothetical protein